MTRNLRKCQKRQRISSVGVREGDDFLPVRGDGGSGKLA
jgi:hypothetical protein